MGIDCNGQPAEYDPEKPSLPSNDVHNGAFPLLQTVILPGLDIHFFLSTYGNTPISVSEELSFAHAPITKTASTQVS